MAVGFEMPSWLNVQPAHFLQAYEAGARHGLSLAEMRNRIAAQQQQHALALEEMQQRAEERQAAMEERRKEHEEEGKLAREKLASTERIASSRENALEDYRNAQMDLREAGLGLQKSGLELSIKKAEEAAKLGDERAANALLSLDLKRQQIEMAKQRLEDARNKPAKEPTVTVTDPEQFGMPTIRRSGPASSMEPYIPRPAVTNAPPEVAPEPSGGGFGGLMRRLMPSREMSGALIEPIGAKGSSRLFTGASPQGTRVRRKTDGRTFVYKGDPQDVPLDSYDILQ